jgi:hypothetical protein
MAGSKRRLLEELVLERLICAIDGEAIMQLQANLVNAVARASPGGEDTDEVARRARQILRRAWRKYGDEVVCVVRDITQATLMPPM